MSFYSRSDSVVRHCNPPMPACLIHYALEQDLGTCQSMHTVANNTLWLTSTTFTKLATRVLLSRMGVCVFLPSLGMLPSGPAERTFAQTVLFKISLWWQFLTLYVCVQWVALAVSSGTDAFNLTQSRPLHFAIWCQTASINSTYCKLLFLDAFHTDLSSCVSNRMHAGILCGCGGYRTALWG